jgi:hypothetical protein
MKWSLSSCALGAGRSVCLSGGRRCYEVRYLRKDFTMVAGTVSIT